MRKKRNRSDKLNKATLNGNLGSNKFAAAVCTIAVYPDGWKEAVRCPEFVQRMLLEAELKLGIETKGKLHSRAYAIYVAITGRVEEMRKAA